MSRWAQVAVTLFVSAVLAFLGLWLYRVFSPTALPWQGSPSQAHPLRPPRVAVLNASGIPRLGPRVAHILETLGYSVRLLTFPEDTLETSVILDHRRPALDLGHRLQRALEIPVVSFDPDPGNPADATVVLGRDALPLLLNP